MTLQNQNLALSLHHIHESLILVVCRIFCILFVLNSFYGAGILLIFLNHFDLSYRPITFATISFVHSLTFLIELILIIYVVVRWATIVYYLTEHQLIKKTGLFKTEEYAYELTHVRTVKLHQSFFGKIFGYGDIFIVLAASGYHEEVHMNHISDPKKYEVVLRSYIEKAVENVETPTVVEFAK